MIIVSRLDGRELVVNAGHLLLVERTPDTVLVLTTGHRIMVRETPEEITSRVIHFRQRIACPEYIGSPLPTEASLNHLDGAVSPPIEEAEL